LSADTKRRAFPSWNKDVALKILQTTSVEPGPVLISLQAIQSRFGYVDDEAVELVALACNVSRAEVHGVLTFYHDLRRTPAPRHVVQICVAEACQSVGSRSLVTAIEGKFGVALGESHPEVEIQERFCLGNCALGPSAVVDGKLIGRCSVEKIRAALARDESI
jgi:formate dehydrogenase subunit gamma